jgi:hypothetical protein
MREMKTKRQTLITQKPTANIDGVENDGRGGYVVSDPVARKLLRVSSTGDVREIAQFTSGPTDIGMVPETTLVLVPHMNESKIVAYSLEEALK